ncbi:hypothetical protein [Falsiroseomonas sp. CW058]|uniref:hypothetical protein n=1 Tax=Falsiroseomonas sp. CW058 TaxID=3388664 RepID=UPI003D31B9AC
MRPRLAGLAFTATLTLAGAAVWAQAEADRQLDAAIERLRAALGPDARITIGSRQVDPVTGRARLGNVTVSEAGRILSIGELWVQELAAGRLGRAEARGLRLEENKNEVTEAGRLLVAGLPLPPPGTALDPASIGFDTFELEGLVSSKPGQGSFRLGRIAARGYVPARGTAPGTLASGNIEGLQLDSLTPDTPSVRLGRMAATEIAFPDPQATNPDPRAFRAAALTIEGMAMTDPARNTDLALPRAALRDWLPGRRTELSVEGLNLAAEFGQLGPGRLQLGRLAVSGLDGASTLAAVMDGVQPPDPAPGVPQTVALEGLVMEAGGSPLFSLGRVAAEGTLGTTGRATGAVLVEGFRASLPRGAAPPLEGMGFREIAGGMELRGEGPRAGGPLSISPWRIQWNDAGALTLQADLDNLPAVPAGAPLSTDRTAEYLKARLVGLTLRWQDQGLFGRALSQQARQQRIPEARLREQWAQMALAMPIPGAPPGAAKGPAADPFAPMRQAIAAFIRQPGAIEVTLRPTTPIAFGAMADLGAAGPAGAAQRLGLAVRVP